MQSYVFAVEGDQFWETEAIFWQGNFCEGRSRFGELGQSQFSEVVFVGGDRTHVHFQECDRARITQEGAITIPLAILVSYKE